MSYGRRRVNCFVVSCNKIYWEYIIVIIALWNHFSHVFAVGTNSCWRIYTWSQRPEPQILSSRENLALLEQPPYSSDYCALWGFIFLEFKGIIERAPFEDVDDNKIAVLMTLRGTQEISFQHCIEAWQRRIEKCIRSWHFWYTIDILFSIYLSFVKMKIKYIFIHF